MAKQKFPKEKELVKYERDCRNREKVKHNCLNASITREMAITQLCSLGYNAMIAKNVVTRWFDEEAVAE